MTPGLTLARVDDIPEGGAKVVEAGGVSLVLTRQGSAVNAFLNRCAHAEYHLEDALGRLTVQEARFLVCHAHGASYASDTGACAGGPCNGKGLTRIAIEVRDGAVLSA